MSTNTTKLNKKLSGWGDSRKGNHEQLTGSGVGGATFYANGCSSFGNFQNKRLIDSTLACNASPNFELRLRAGIRQGQKLIKVQGQSGTNLGRFGQCLYWWLSKSHCGFYDKKPSASERQENAICQAVSIKLAWRLQYNLIRNLPFRANDRKGYRTFKISLTNWIWKWDVKNVSQTWTSAGLVVKA